MVSQGPFFSVGPYPQVFCYSNVKQTSASFTSAQTHHPNLKLGCRTLLLGLACVSPGVGNGKGSGIVGTQEENVEFCLYTISKTDTSV